MKRIAKILIVNFPILIVAGQVAANIVYLIDADFYSRQSFYFSGAFGLNWVTAAFMIAFTFYFRFCSISRVCAVAEGLFSIGDFFIRDNEFYNIFLQVLGGGLALLITLILFFSNGQRSNNYGNNRSGGDFY